MPHNYSSSAACIALPPTVHCTAQTINYQSRGIQQNIPDTEFCEKFPETSFPALSTIVTPVRVLQRCRPGVTPGSWSRSSTRCSPGSSSSPPTRAVLYCTVLYCTGSTSWPRTRAASASSCWGTATTAWPGCQAGHLSWNYDCDSPNTVYSSKHPLICVTVFHDGVLAVSRPDHADCCVQLARLMITAIGAVRRQCREPDLDMRIGNNELGVCSLELLRSGIVHCAVQL